MIRALKWIPAVTLLSVFNTGTAWAVQGHGAPEGIYVHQMGHLFFALAMTVFILRLRERNMHHQRGWRMIQWSAFFFILWNLDTFTAHFIEEQIELASISRVSVWTVKLTAPLPDSIVPGILYMLKLDHLLSVPAMIFLFMGLKDLIPKTEPADVSHEDPR